ncbi:MAG: deoxyguanosinetriphosphate triphosphohydrolase [Burkholderiales bacterium]|nr:deoxyguanosinetriphosphate triphosphohydrolase [Burkholderiales bacterium]
MPSSPRRLRRLRPADRMPSVAPYAAQAANSRGRRWPESPAKTRSEFQRDRDRVIHCTAFRRLEYKTQVFVNHEGDLFRTRLTHSIEVAQLARSVARQLELDEDLAEAISLAHDLGHTPFGHAGQDALNACMREHGGFEHNLQSLRVVDLLEERYGAFDGLNLTFETREGILKHCTAEIAAGLGDVGRRFIEGTRPSLEAQITNLADEIAYNNHDIDDGLRSGLLSVEQMRSVEVFDRFFRESIHLFPQAVERRLVNETVRRMINFLVQDLVATTHSNLCAADPRSPDDVRSAPTLVAHSATVAAETLTLKRFLRDNLYQHYLVQRMSSKGRRIVSDLFDAFYGDVRLLPPQYQAKAAENRPRAVADYISGMTDRYAMREHRRLFTVDDR